MSESQAESLSTASRTLEKGKGKVLVSGANGFVATWIVKSLLDRGYSVRGTVRDASKAVHLHKIFGTEFENRFESIVVEDITKKGAFDTAIQGVDAIIHTATNVTFSAGDPDELIVPAVEGTLSILESALNTDSKIKRVVLLSSTAAVAGDSGEGDVDEKMWNEEAILDVREHGRSASQLNKYRAAKYLSERAAWDFVERYKGEIKWDLVTLCPPFIFGPILHEVHSLDKLNESMQMFLNVVLKGEKKPAGNQSGWADVRDVGEAHVLSLEKADAGGRRFVLSAGMYIWQDFYDAANSLGISGISSPIGTPGLGATTKFKKPYKSDSAKAVLGLSFRDIRTTTEDTILSLQQLGYKS